MTAIVSPSAIAEYICFFIRNNLVTDGIEVTPATPLEQLESVDMMRLLEHGLTVKMVPTEFNTQAVDTPADLARVEQLMKNDPLLFCY